MKPPLDPILIRFGPDFGIHWYGILIVTGVMLGAVYASWRARQDGQNPDHVWNGLIFAIILASLILRERFTRRKLVAVLLAMAGVVVVTLNLFERLVTH